MFVEKPISVTPPEEMQELLQALHDAKGHGVIVSVGYHFRYSKALDKMKSILREISAPSAEHSTVVKTVVLTYNSAYTGIRKSMWWDMRLSGGPIVEQSTHFVDLARYIAGEVDPKSVRAYHIGPRCPLENVPSDAVSGRNVEEGVPDEFRIPRATTAIWKFESGALGSLTHAALLQGDKYECEMQVWGDGVQMVLEDPYNACRLRVRTKESEVEHVFSFEDDDPYENELQAFVSAIRSQDRSQIRSPYEDAFETYKMTWAIRRAAELSEE